MGTGSLHVRSVEVEAARRGFLAGGARTPGPDLVAPAVVASWQRSLRSGVDPDQVRAPFVGHSRQVSRVVHSAEEVLEAFTTEHPDSGCSTVLLDEAGVVRVRRDGDPALAALLDGLLVVPGYAYDERSVGTTAASIALHDQTDTAVSGVEHFHSQLTCLAEAAAVLTDPQTGGAAGVLAVVRHDADRTALQLPLARMLADRIVERAAGEPHRAALAILDRFRAEAGSGSWVLATDGDSVVTNGPVRRLSGADQRVLSDLLLSSLVLADVTAEVVELPSGQRAAVAVLPVHVAGASVGGVLSASPAGEGPAVAPESVRRQGSHVAPLTRRDYAQDLRATGQERAQAGIRANRELLSPYSRARSDVVASIRQGRNHLLIGEPGVGKRTVLVEQFRAAYPAGRIVTVDGETYGADGEAGLAEVVDSRPHLVLLRSMHLLSPIGARRLDEVLRPIVALSAPPLVVGCVDTPAVDATRPYGLLLRHFNEVTRVPALRYRADEIGDIALAVLRRLSGRRSLRLSLQVVRVLEGYAWPGNISELEDVLRFVVARKPVGEIRASDLPQLCFQGRNRKLSMLEAAQCDAVIQALYECGGNRYRAAAMLGIARSSLYRKIDAFGISYIA